MNTYVLDVIQKYKNKGILIDTNIALVYIVGTIDVSEIRKQGRTSNYNEEDFSRISKFIEHFPKKATTPHVLTELSNLLPNRPELLRALAGFIERAVEIFEDSISLTKTQSFFEIGLADTAILKATKGLYLVLTQITQ